MQRRSGRIGLAGLIGLAWMLGGCGQTETTAPTSAPVSSPPPMSAPSGRASGSRQEAFLARIRRASATNGVVLEARMRGDDELGVVLGKQVKLKQIKPLMTTMLKEMRDEFPGRPLTVRAYAPNNQPLAVMRYNPSAPSNANVTFDPSPGR